MSGMKSIVAEHCHALISEYVFENSEELLGDEYYGT